MAHTYKPWTSAEIKQIVQLWESKTTKEIAEDLGRSVAVIQAVATRIRKAGYPLMRKNRAGELQNLIKETLGL